MEAFLWTVVAVLGGVLLLVSVWSLLVGVDGAVDTQFVQRCPRCGHLGFRWSGQVHARSCPVDHLHHHMLAHTKVPTGHFRH